MVAVRCHTVSDETGKQRELPKVAVSTSARGGTTCLRAVARLAGMDHPSTTTELLAELLSVREAAALPPSCRDCSCGWRFLLLWLLPVSARERRPPRDDVAKRLSSVESPVAHAGLCSAHGAWHHRWTPSLWRRAYQIIVARLSTSPRRRRTGARSAVSARATVIVRVSGNRSKGSPRREV